MRAIYFTEDGKKFSSKEAAEKHEAELLEVKKAKELKKDVVFGDVTIDKLYDVKEEKRKELLSKIEVNNKKMDELSDKMVDLINQMSELEDKMRATDDEYQKYKKAGDLMFKEYRNNYASEGFAKMYDCLTGFVESLGL